MPHGGFSGSLKSPRLDLAVDMGHPFLNRTVDGFIKIGTVSSQPLSSIMSAMHSSVD